MKRSKSLSMLATIASMILLAGCERVQRENNVEADERALLNVVDEATDAFIARDWDAFADFFADDGIWMPPGFAPLTGKDAWWSFVEPWWDSSKTIDMDVTTEELVVIDDWAIERHSEYQLATFGENAEPVSLYFKGMWIFRRRDDGSWQIARYIWNENTPPE